MSAPVYYSTEHAAAQLGITRQAVHEAVHRGVFPVSAWCQQPKKRIALLSEEDIEYYRKFHLGRRGRRRAVYA